MAFLSAQLQDAAGSEWSERDAGELAALLAEYDSLRQESMNTTNNRIQVMMLGLGAVLTLAAGGLVGGSGRQGGSVLIAAYCYAIPIVCSFILLVWLSEAVRAHRVGYYLASAVEARINNLIGRFALGWETSLWVGLMPRDELLGPSMMAMAMLGVIAAGSPVIGVQLAGWRFAWKGEPMWHVALPFAGLFAVALYVFFNRNRLMNIPSIRSQEHHPGDPGNERGSTPPG